MNLGCEWCAFHLNNHSPINAIYVPSQFRRWHSYCLTLVTVTRHHGEYVHTNVSAALCVSVSNANNVLR